MRAKKCKNCGNRFTPKYRSTEQVCSFKCAAELGKSNARKKERKSWQRKKRKLKNEIQTKAELMKLLQKVVNAYVRERDKNKPCISCGKPLGRKYDAGHYRSVGSTPELRFNLKNIHAQCVHCNQHLHGNLIEYRKGLIERYNEDYVDYLEGNHPSLHLTKPEIREMIKEFKVKLKELKG
ncbi:recombination protein NinG [Flavobacteriaceae bacterium Ap0902]|nr:recombination protein NinG [Flavobacteriaceae bacterium Ap0902]